MDDEGVRLLCSNIVKRAIDDYYIACKKEARRRAGKTDKHPAHLKECEAFFKSDWAKLVTDLDLEVVAKEIRKKAGLEE